MRTSRGLKMKVRKILSATVEKRSYLIDIDILIYSIKGRKKILQKFRDHRNDPQVMSIIT